MLHVYRKINGYHPYVTILLIATFFLTMADAASVLFLPLYLVKEVGMEPIWIGLLSGVAPLSATVGGFLSGSLSDILGRKTVLVASLFLYALSLAGFMASTQLPLLMVCMLLKGFFSGCFTPVAKALMGDVTIPEKRLKVFSLRYLTVNIAYALGPVLALSLGLEGKGEAFLLAAGTYFVAGCILFAVFRRSEMATSDAAERLTMTEAWRAVYMDRRLLFLIVGGILSAVVHGQWSVPLQQHLHHQQVDAAELFTLIIGVNSMGVILLQVPLTRVAARFTPLTSIAVGSCLFAVGMLGFGLAASWWHYVLSMLVFTIGEVLVTPAEYLLLDQITPSGLRGTYYGAQSFTALGSFAGPWVGSALLAQATGGFLAFAAYALIALVSIGVFWRGTRLARQDRTVVHG